VRWGEDNPEAYVVVGVVRVVVVAIGRPAVVGVVVPVAAAIHAVGAPWTKPIKLSPVNFDCCTSIYAA
jgi:hypothetical protein